MTPAYLILLTMITIAAFFGWQYLPGAVFFRKTENAG